jgi:3-hydroxyisobutyrate dehydrogenase
MANTAAATVWTGDYGALSAATADDALAVECSTLSHDWVLAFKPTAEAAGFRVVDCPVTGGPDDAAEGALTLLVGAEDADLEAARPLLEPLSTEIIHFGPVGTGTAYKLMVNLMGTVQIVALAEGLLITEKAGLDMETVDNALGRGSAASRKVIRTSRRMLDADHEQNVIFSGHWRLKDALYGLKLAKKLGQATPLGDAAAEAFQKLVDAGLGDWNESKIIDMLRS